MKISTKELNNLFEFEREVVLYAVNDKRLTVTDISDSISVFGYSPKEFTSGKIGWLDIMHPDDKNCFAECADIKTSAHSSCEFRIYTKSGTVSRVACACIAEADDTGKIARFLVKIKDVGEQKQYGEKLQNNESAIRNIFEHSANGMLLTDKNGTIRDWNHGYEIMTGLSREKVVGKPLWEVASSVFLDKNTKETRRKTVAEMKQLLSGIKQSTINHQIVNCSTGKLLKLNSIFFPFEAPDGGTTWGVISYDVTELMRSWDLILEDEYQLAIERAHLKALDNSIPNGCLFRLVSDVKNHYRSMSYVGATWEDITGIPTVAVFADFNVIFDVMHPEDIPYFQKAIEENRQTMSNLHCEIRIAIDHDHSNWRWLHISAHPLIDEQKMLWDGIILDITGRKKIEFELENIHRCQATIIKILKTVQSAQNVQEAMQLSLAEMGESTGVSRVFVFEKSEDGTSVNNVCDWNKEGIKPIIKSLHNLPIKLVQPWFDIFEAGRYVCTSDIKTLTPELTEALDDHDVKSIVVFPLSSGNEHYGFVGFDECTTNKMWSQMEIELLRNLSQIISTTSRHWAVSKPE